jgi:hypothetical protein
MSDLDTRLRAFHDSLVASFMEESVYPRRTSPSRGLRTPLLVVAAAIAVVLAIVIPVVASQLARGQHNDTVGLGGTITLNVPGFTVVAAADGGDVTPQIPREQASSVALSWLHSNYPTTHGYQITAATFQAHTVSVRWRNGGYSTTDRPADLWLVLAVAPSQQGWLHVEGDALVDAHTGKVVQASQATDNCPCPTP